MKNEYLKNTYTTFDYILFLQQVKNIIDNTNIKEHRHDL